MPDVHDAFFHGDDGGFIVILHTDIKCSASHRNYRCRRENPIVIGLPAPLLDVDFHPSDQNIQQVAPIPGILAEDDIGIRVDLESAPVGNLELREAVWTGYDDLPYLYLIADIKRPGSGIAKY
jgi:hypothetical protein